MKTNRGLARAFLVRALACAFVVLGACVPATPLASAPAMANRPAEGTVPSSDGVPIHYVSYGAGPMAVVLVHCWSCSALYWDGQIAALTPRWRVVTVDLAGHGSSGKGRTVWSMAAFGQDVRAVVTALGLKRVVLVGHSMGGPVILEAAQQMPERVAGLVPIDTLHDVERQMPAEAKEALFARLRQDFRGTTTELVRRLFPPSADPAVVDRVIADEVAADPNVGVAALEALFRYDEARALDRIHVPIHAINADLLPTNLEADRRHAPQFDVVTMKGVGHWLMLERPAEFNALLVGALEKMKVEDPR